MATLALPILPSTMRVVQPGAGSPRPLLLAYHVPKDDDDALRSALGPGVLIAVDNRPAWEDYAGVEPLSKIVPLLEQRFGTKLGPVLAAGFSAGGNGTRTILAQGGDPNALITADATYGSSPESMSDWAAYAKRAAAGTRVFIASHTSYLGQSDTWGVLQSITGWKLPLGPVAGAPAGTQTIVGDHERRQRGNLIVYSFPTWDMPGHMLQASSVLPAMASEALRMVGGATGKSSPWGLMFAGLLAGAFLIRRKRV